LNFVKLLAIALVGLFSHWLKKWGRGQTKAGFVEYMRVHRRHSIASVCAVIGEVVSLYLSGQAGNELAPGLAFMAGFVADSVMNKAPAEK
jgi:hypothetical protein